MAADVLALPIPFWTLPSVGVYRRRLRAVWRRASLSDEAMAILVCDSKRYAAAQRREIAAQGRYTGGMRALGMRSRVPAGRA